MQRASEKVIKLFSPYSVTLDNDGNLSIPNEHKDNPILKKLLTNHPNIKYLLMYKDLFYESALKINIKN